MEFVDYLIDLGNWVWGWYGDADNQNRSNALITAAGFLAIVIGFIGTALWWIVKFLFKSKSKPPSENPPPLTGPIITMSLDDFQQKLDEREAEVRTELETATADQAEVLNNQLADVQRQRANPDQALNEAKTRIAKLEQLLERAGNDIGGERLNKARTALEAADYTLADGIFAEIEVRADIEVKSAARAAYGRGEIAEAEIRWSDAANHYTKSARLDPTYDTLIKAGDFLWRAGQHQQAIRVEEELVELARRDYGDADEKTATALNNLANSYQAAGDYAAAEPLFRQALAIGEKTIGKDHPAYATRLNNLAGLLRDKGDYDGAEPLFRQALAIGAKTIGKDHPAYATRLNNLAGLLQAKGDYDGAEPLFRQAVSVIEAALGADHPDSKKLRANLEQFLQQQSNP